MYGRAAGLDRFKKAQSLEPFSVSANSSSKPSAQAGTQVISHSSALPSQSQTSFHQVQYQQQAQQVQHHASHGATGLEAAPLLGQTQQATQVGGGQSTWQPPDWAIEPRPGVYYLEVLKDGQVLDRINLDRRRHIFGRQIQTCDFVLDHQSVSRQHAAVIPHKNGSIYVIDLGSAHGTFVANERLTKDSPVELEVGQSLRFAASTRTYMLRKNDAALFPRPPVPAEINLPPPPDPSDEEAVVAYNTLLNRYGLGKADQGSRTVESGKSATRKNDNHQSDRASKRIRKMRVAFRDQVGGELVEVVGVSDGADVETEPGPVGVKEGSLVGKYESLVQITVIPKGKEQSVVKEADSSQKGVTDKLQEVLKKVKTTQKGGIYDDLYGESFSAKVGSSWAYSSVSTGEGTPPGKVGEGNTLSGKPESNLSSVDGDNDDDLFG
ncbi:protein phosphatase 1 regulatory inhibitor subunit PPP1R8 homolog [Prosopis cineraria]|uniref:protein phosphatase 1 regulatory inhibitor subunit PPP1R8 homolog n=1 Tax=Prosopis cineraria TaxID=364024 RepID=UPI0024109D8F|nr:protein phosphatase 1 regulatory inhibitor subunit PPP1R8 homolog [Prosopis cineraria]XP_054815839.1 protein phosphatase 1 regulatory inhibitor subunit PPP1R8 homolog [Prosopis cineraria]